MTTKELFKQYKIDYHFEEGPPEDLVDEWDFEKALLEFAQFHVKEATKAIINNLKIKDKINISDENLILNSYPLTNIK